MAGCRPLWLLSGGQAPESNSPRGEINATKLMLSFRAEVRFTNYLLRAKEQKAMKSAYFGANVNASL